ncbi:MAG: hypothetical protein ACRD26_19245, partial [Vicinamibacterales bacterium]
AWLSAALLPGCGEVARTGRSPAQLVIMALEAASGADDTVFSPFLLSDVVTRIDVEVNGQQESIETIFNDPGRVTMRLVLRNPGIPGNPTTPTALNAITITRYRVEFIRADGRNTPGVDVPYPFDGAVTFTIPADGDVTTGFNLVRHTAKLEAPLMALRNGLFISTMAEVTFYGRDQAGNEVAASGTINVEFGNFADPE